MGRCRPLHSKMRSKPVYYGRLVVVFGREKEMSSEVREILCGLDPGSE